ncbi:hypothetical protein Pint_24248 [Pistacia integerrima]|uniref:Uncharacterized protein n=1 Tax=Pistacia integerrima TaxID=434235 RepID=A0ACC0YCJ9_9ROSI|nr:hypothetical protein Pint_24248 [Pistacia integerrima]
MVGVCSYSALEEFASDFLSGYLEDYVLCSLNLLIEGKTSDECLLELAVCSYKARRVPLSVLCTYVLSVYEPNEHPSTMQRLYQWTPNECIPEFFCDPQIFYFVHSSMTDLALPSWAGSPGCRKSPTKPRL